MIKIRLQIYFSGGIDSTIIDERRDFIDENYYICQIGWAGGSAIPYEKQ